MKNYITDINLQDDYFFLYYNDGNVKTIPFSKFNKSSIRKIISIFLREKNILQEVIKKMKLMLFFNIFIFFIIIAICSIIYNLFSSSIVTEIMILITGINFSIVNLLGMSVNYNDLEKIKNRTIPNIDSQVEILKQQIDVLENIKNNSNIIEFKPFYKQKILTNDLKQNYSINYSKNDVNGKILIFKKR